MPVDRNLKKKRKREKHKKKRSQIKERSLRYEKAEDYGWEAYDAYRQKDYQSAYNLAMKGLRLHPTNTTSYHYAWIAARIRAE